MIPLRLVWVDLKRVWAASLVIILLIGLATAFGIGVSLQERALRLGSARAAERFDLVIGAAGSETQLVLSSVFLQPSPLPLMPGSILGRLGKDPRVAWAAPVGFGDSFAGYPIVGTTSSLMTDLGKAPPREGHAFTALQDAVIGADVPMAMGDAVKPTHGLAGEGGHTHTELAYRIVGRMAATSTPWDRAILVPIEAVWRIHGLDEGVDHDVSAGAGPAPSEGARGAGAPPDHLGPPWHPFAPGVPAVVVKARTIADAYKLRQDYRKDQTVAVFPAEVLTRLYATLGDVRMLLSAIAAGTQALVAAAVILVSVIYLAQRRRQIGILRALGAHRLTVFLLVWTELLALIGAGVLAGVGLGLAGARMVASAFTRTTGVHLPVGLEASDWAFAGMLLLVAGVLALLPAWLAYRQPAAAALRG